jgi:hypothetical protein
MDERSMHMTHVDAEGMVKGETDPNGVYHPGQ